MEVIMKRLLLFIPVLSVLVFGCSTVNQLNKNKLTADQLYQKGNYQEALNLWETQIASFESKGNETECPVYTSAAFANMKLGNTQQALDLLKKATYSKFIADSTYSAMADIYRQQDNLSLEMVSLQDYISNFHEGKKISSIKLRLFELYVESQNWEPAMAEWEHLTIDQRAQESTLLNYFTVNKAVEHSETCDTLAIRLLKLNNNQPDALRWLGKKYYRKAEDRYQKEMKAYDDNKTRKQYAQLLKALDEVTVDYKTSLKYFKQYYKVSPQPTTARYLSYIYNRLDDKQKSEYYLKLTEK